VIEDEIRSHLAAYPKNQAILDASWLEAATVTEPPALKDVADIHKRYGRQAGQDRGEAEVVVLCAGHGWTGIIDDSNGQKAAREYKAPHCSISTRVGDRAAPRSPQTPFTDAHSKLASSSSSKS
jgi:hypothetical protein